MHQLCKLLLELFRHLRSGARQSLRMARDGSAPASDVCEGEERRCGSATGGVCGWELLEISCSCTWLSNAPCPPDCLGWPSARTRQRDVPPGLHCAARVASAARSTRASAQLLRASKSTVPPGVERRSRRNGLAADPLALVAVVAGDDGRDRCLQMPVLRALRSPRLPSGGCGARLAPASWRRQPHIAGIAREHPCRCAAFARRLLRGCARACRSVEGPDDVSWWCMPRARSSTQSCRSLRAHTASTKPGRPKAKRTRDRFFPISHPRFSSHSPPRPHVHPRARSLLAHARPAPRLPPHVRAPWTLILTRAPRHSRRAAPFPRLVLRPPRRRIRPRPSPRPASGAPRSTGRPRTARRSSRRTSSWTAGEPPPLGDLRSIVRGGGDVCAVTPYESKM
jgi:hypothetical protein